MWSSKKSIHYLVTSPPNLGHAYHFDVVKPSDKCIELFESGTGLKMVKKDYAGWMNIRKDVPMHRDFGGRCIVYVAKGSGVFRTKNRAIPITEGFFLEFNDGNDHAFDLLSRTAVLFVCNVKGKYKFNLDQEHIDNDEIYDRYLGKIK